MCFPDKSAVPNLCVAESFDALSNVGLQQVQVDIGQLLVVVEEPLDVGDHGAHQGLHGGAGPEVLCLSHRPHTLGQPTDAADLQEQRPVILAEGRHAAASLTGPWPTWGGGAIVETGVS